MARQGTQSGGTRRGYKQTEIGEIPVEWEVKSLDMLADVRLSSVDKKVSPHERAVNVCNYLHVYNNRRIDESVAFDQGCVSDSEFEKFSLIEGDVVITKDSEDPTDIAVPAFIAKTLPDLVCGYHLAILRPKAVLGEFLARVIEAPIYNKYFRNHANGATRFGLTIDTIEGASLPLPPLPEQKKIAAILSSVDDAIRSTQAVIDQARTLKKGLLGQLLTRGIGHKKFKQTEIGEIPVEWEVKTLGEICERIMDGTHFSPKTKSGPRPYLTSKNIRMGYIDLSNLSFISEEEHREIYQKCPVLPDDILLTKDGANTGNCAINSLEYPFSLLSSVAVLRPKSHIITGSFLYQCIASDAGQKSIVGAVAGQAITRITLEKINRFIMPFPPLPEQKQIAEILSGVDAVIRQNSDQVEQLKQTKAGLMQDLLTGRKRVAV